MSLSTTILPEMLMKKLRPNFRTALVAVLGLALPVIGQAQNGLKDIPDTSIEAALAGFKLPEGAKINLFAGDPDINKPVQMNWDAQGRLWMVSSPLYPHIKPGQQEADRVLVLEDTDSDGVADKVTTFADGLYIPTAVIPGDGGAYVANSTEVLFLKDTDGDGKADSREVILSGFGTEDTHHLLHTFRHGPEGLLYMNQSIYIHSHVETPYGVRRLLGGGMWHLRPETREMEVFYKGLVNPWGTVFDRWGQAFATDGAGSEGINFVYPRAVFKTSPGASRVLDGLSPGQPKHCGIAIVDGRYAPDDWQGNFVAPDFRGHRVNRFKLEESGSGYVATQIEDLVSSTHRAFRPIDVQLGPDGAIYIADWYNPIIQHGEVDFRDPRRDHQHGRIWRISFEGRNPVERPNIVGAPVGELLAMLKAEETWTRHFAKQELRARGAAAVKPALSEWVAGLAADDTHAKLEALWLYQHVNLLDQDLMRDLLGSDNAHARAAALRTLYFRHAEVEDAFALASKASTDAHAQVRLWALSVLAQLDEPDTVKVALAVLKQDMDENLDFALWSLCREHESRWLTAAQAGNPFADMEQYLFAVRALGRPVGVDRVLDALNSDGLDAKAMPQVADFVSRVGNAEQLARLFAYGQSEGRTEAEKIAVIEALTNAANLRKLKPGGDLATVSSFLVDADGATERFSKAAALSGLWKVEAARGPIEKAFLQADSDEGRARAAMEGLRALGGPKSAQLFEKTARDGGLSYLQRSLGAIGRVKMNPEAGAAVAIEVLKDSPDGKDPAGIYDAFLATKQGPPALAKALAGAKLPQEIALSGVHKASSAATSPQGLIKAIQNAAGLKPMKSQLTPAEMEAMMQAVAEHGDPHRGEEVYRRAQLMCTTCHAIGGVGGVIGPDLVSIGSSAPVDYLVESLIDPSKKIKEGYHTTLVTTKKGDAFAGAVASENGDEVVIRDAAGQEQRIAKVDIANTTVSPVSLMPPGLTASLREDEFVDLVRFLSELGKEGAFKTSPKRFVRNWQAMMPHDSTRDTIGHYGESIFVDAKVDYQWTPAYADVSGGLPAEGLPQMVGRGANRYAVGRFVIAVEQAGSIGLKLPKTKDVTLFVGAAKIDLPENAGETVVPLQLPEGKSTITVVGLLGFGLDELRVEIVEAAGAGKAARVSLPSLVEW